jgi:hypothetical protein
MFPYSSGNGIFTVDNRHAESVNKYENFCLKYMIKKKTLKAINLTM